MEQLLYYNLNDACANADLKAVKEYIKNGANPNNNDNAEHATALHFLASYIGPENLEEAATPARELNKMANMLLKAGADIKAKDVAGNTPAHLLTYQTINLASTFLEAGTDIKAKNNQGNTLLHSFVWLDTPAALKMLIKAKADVNAQNNAGSTPLHTAVSCNIPKALPVLLQAGADMDIKNEMGKTALDLAKESGNQKMVSVLEAYKAQKDYKSGKKAETFDAKKFISNYFDGR